MRRSAKGITTARLCVEFAGKFGDVGPQRIDSNSSDQGVDKGPHDALDVPQCPLCGCRFDQADRGQCHLLIASCIDNWLKKGLNSVAAALRRDCNA
jgi:hypothetical protein